MESEEVWGTDNILIQEICELDTNSLQQRILLIENETRVLKQEHSRLQHQIQGLSERLKDFNEKIKLNKQLPYLVSNVVEVFNILPVSVFSIFLLDFRSWV